MAPEWWLLPEYELRVLLLLLLEPEYELRVLLLPLPEYELRVLAPLPE